jgi:hypothetical protein
LGTAVALPPTVALFRADLNTEKFLAVLGKLVDRGDYPKARRLCRAVPKQCHVGALVARALDLRLEATVLVEGDEADYRSAPETVPLEDRARDALEPYAEEERGKAMRRVVIAGAGGAMAAGSLLPPWPAVPTLVGALGVILALLALRMHANIRRGIALVMERVPPWILPEKQMHDE